MDLPVKGKDKFDACMTLAEYAAKNFHKRREFEWKVTLGSWALLVATIAFVQQNPQGPVATAVPSWSVFLSVIAFAFFWLRATWVANDNDKSLAHHFLYAAEAMLHDPPLQTLGKRPPKLKIWNAKWWFGFLTDWSPWFQLITTGFLATLLYLVLPK